MYVLVTNFKDFWDNIKGRRPSYPKRMIHTSELKDGADAIFLRIDEEGGRLQRGWRGTVHDIRPETEKTYFDLTLVRELDASELRHYERFRRSGWFEDNSGEPASKEEQYRNLAVEEATSGQMIAEAIDSALKSSHVKGGDANAMAELINGIHRVSKLYFIRPGRYHLFGTDFEARDAMSEDEAVERFDQVWLARIRQAVLAGGIITADEAMRLIGDKAVEYQRRGYFQHEQEHRQFNLANTAFVAQVNRSKQPPEQTQLWPAAVKNYDTRTLFVTFDTQAERNEWKSLAGRFQLPDDELGRLVLTSFLDVFTRIRQSCTKTKGDIQE
jgi:hypothetical protein